VQDGEANDKVHSYVRIQFHCNAAYDARQGNPTAAFIKELSFRSAKSDAAQKFVQVRAQPPRSRCGCPGHASHPRPLLPFLA